MNQSAKVQTSRREASLGLRKTSFQTRNRQTVELFQEKLRGRFELWLVGQQAQERVILNHYLTHDDLEARLRYAKSTMLNWSPARESDLPDAKSPTALSEEGTIESGTYWDSAELSEHVSGVEAMDCDQAALEEARQRLAGTWSDGASSMTFGADLSFQYSVSATSHSGFLQALPRIQPDKWQLSEHWQLRVMNGMSHRAERKLVHRVTDSELHLAGDGNCVAFVLKRK